MRRAFLAPALGPVNHKTTPRLAGSGLAAATGFGYPAGMIYIFLIVAIVAEVIATSAMAKSDGFTRIWPSLIAFSGYGLAFYLLSVVTRTVPVGIVYAVWSGAGIVLVAAVGWLFFGQKLDLPATIGMAMIVAGVLIINLMSKSVSH
jgi:small multidrug resistance pump